MKKVSFRKNNGGFTLTEMIVVVAIIAILAGVSTYSISQIYSTRARKFTNELVALMAECKIDAISGAQQLAYLELSQKDGDIYGCLYEGGTETPETSGTKVKENLLGTGVNCVVCVDGINYTIAGNTTVRIAFQRATGALKNAEVRNPDKKGTLGDIVISGGRYNYTIKVVASTGYYYVE